MKLWLDDVRPAPAGWTLVKTAKEAIDLISEYMPYELSLDHDLGDALDAGTGYDVLKYIENIVHEKPDTRLPNISLHTSNPVGKQMMELALAAIFARSERSE